MFWTLDRKEDSVGTIREVQHGHRRGAGLTGEQVAAQCPGEREVHRVAGEDGRGDVLDQRLDGVIVEWDPHGDRGTDPAADEGPAKRTRAASDQDDEPRRRPRQAVGYRGDRDDLPVR